MQTRNAYKILYPSSILHDADRVRVSERKHTVQEVDGDGDLSFLSDTGLILQLVADHLLKVTDRGPDTRTLAVTGSLVPTDAATVGQTLQKKVTLGLIGLGRSRSLPRWIAAVRRPQ
jgi:hypothetical protein